MRRTTRVWVSLFLSLGACGESHTTTPEDGGRLDAGDRVDGGIEDAGPSDLPDAGATPLECELESGDAIGEGCFCRGPLVQHERYLYRQAIGIEVYRIDAPDVLTRVGTVEERPGSEGGLVIADGHLVSLLDFEDQNLVVYSLADPASPARLGSVALPEAATSRLVATGSEVVVARSTVGSASLVSVDVSDPEAPRIAWTREVEGAVLDIARSPRGIFVLEERSGREAFLGRRDGSGALLDELSLGVGSHFFRRVATDGDEVLVSGGEGRRLARYSVGAGLSLRDVLDGDPERSGGGSILIRGDLAFVAAPPTLVDLSGELRELVTVASPIGDLGHLDAPGGPLEWLYASGGNGVVPLQVVCD